MAEWFHNNWLLCIVAAFVAATTLHCYHRGLIRTALEMAAMVLSIIATRILTPVVAAYVSDYMNADTIGRYGITVACFIVLFFVVRFVIGIVIRITDLVTKLPLIHGLNQIAGAILGLAISLTIVWFGDLILDLFKKEAWAMAPTAQIEASNILLFIRENNLLRRLLSNITFSMKP